MPIYEYKCADCGAHLEKRQSVSEEPLTVCEACGGRLEKQWSLSGFQFKGAGWYVTDYSNKGSAGAEKSGEKSKDASTEKTSSSESTNSAPAASKEPTVSKPADKKTSGS